MVVSKSTAEPREIFTKGKGHKLNICTSEIFIKGKGHKLNICVSVGFRLFTRVEQTVHSKFNNSNEKFQLKVTSFSTYISNYECTLFLYFFSVFQNVQNGFKIVSPQKKTVWTVRHLEWTCAQSESRDRSVQRQRLCYCLTPWSLPGFITSLLY